MKVKKIIGYDETKRRTLEEVLNTSYEPICTKENNENFKRLLEQEKFY